MEQKTAWIAGQLYMAGRVAKVINQHEIPAGEKSGMWAGSPCKISRAARPPSTWDSVPGYRGQLVKYTDGEFVDAGSEW